MINQLLNDYKINEIEIYNLLNTMSDNGSDYSDLFFQHSIAESWVLDEGIVKDGSYNIAHGVGARCVSGDQTGFSYSDDLNLKAIKGAIDFAKGISFKKSKMQPRILKTSNHPSKYAAISPLDSITSKQKVDLLRQIDSIARKEPKVVQVNASLSGAYTEVLIASTDGVYQVDCRPMVRVNVSVIVEHNGRIEQGSTGGGGRYDYSYFAINSLVETYTKEAIRLALVALDSNEAPAGKMPVILGSGWPGVLLHEAIGHGLEGDFNRKGTSVFSGRIGEKVAS